MSISSHYTTGRYGLSFELFPPKSDEGLQSLRATIDELKSYKPDYFTCTYGASGSTQSRTLQTIQLVKQCTALPTASHLTCVGSTLTQLRNYLSGLVSAGVNYVVALRGDPPKGQSSFAAVPGGLRYANELVELIHREFPDLSIAVAGYPETHQEASSRQCDIDNLKRKVDAGASIIITQLFYDNSHYFRFRDDCRKNRIDVPIIPGIMPITNLKQVQRITELCKSALPIELINRLAENDSTDWQMNVGIETATQQVADLLQNSVPGLHFYVLNKSQPTSSILENINKQSL